MGSAYPSIGVFPAWTSNPYLEDLERAVAPHGYEFVYPGPSKFRFEIVQHVRALELDLVHLHWQHPYLLGKNLLRTGARSARFLLDIARVRRTGVPVVWTIHNTVNHERQHERAERLASAALFRLVDKPVVHCAGVMDFVQDCYWLTEGQRDRIEAIPHGNYSGSYAPPPTRREAREQLGISPDSVAFLHFGNLRTYKHVDAILRAFHQVDDPAAVLVVAGGVRDADIRSAISQLALRDSRIKLFLDGMIPDSDVPTFFAAADAFVYAAYDIFMSGAVMLALTYGLPIVAPRAGCLPEVIPEDGAFWYAPYDEEGLTRALGSATTSVLEPMAKLNRSAGKDHAWSKIGERWSKLYATLLESGRGDLDST